MRPECSLLLGSGYKVAIGLPENTFEAAYQHDSVLALFRDYPSTDDLLRCWEDDQRNIAGVIQPKLERKTKWDIYFVICLAESLGSGSVSSIERIQDDTRFCRKIIMSTNAEVGFLKGLGQLPFVQLKITTQTGTDNMRAFFLERMAKLGNDSDLVRTCLGMKADDIAAELTRWARKRT